MVFNINKNPYYVRYSSFPRVIYTSVQSFQTETLSLTSSEFGRSVYEVHSWNPFRLLLPTHARQWGCVTGFQKEPVFVRTVAFVERKRNRQWATLEHNHFREHYSVWVLLAAVFPNFSLNGYLLSGKQQLNDRHASILAHTGGISLCYLESREEEMNHSVH